MITEADGMAAFIDALMVLGGVVAGAFSVYFFVVRNIRAETTEAISVAVRTTIADQRAERDVAIKAALAEHLRDHVTPLTLVREYVERKEYEKHQAKMERKLDWHSQVLVAMAQSMRVQLPAAPDND